MNKKKLGKQKGRLLDSAALLEVQELMLDMPRRKDLLIEVLHLIQDEYHFLSTKHLVALAFEMKLAHTEVYEVATFYHHFDVIKENETPPPPLTVRVCESLTCEMSGAKELTDALKHIFPELRRTRITERQPGRKLSQQNKRGPCIVIFSQPAQIAVEESDARTLCIHSGTFFKYPGIS